MEGTNNNKEIEKCNNNGEKTFNKLLQIQTLIKKESSKKELCKNK